MTIRKKIRFLFEKLTWMEKIIYPFSIVLFISFLGIALSPVYKYEEYEHLAESDSLLSMKYDPIYDHPEIMAFQREVTYKEALIELAGKDSIQLVINLADSTLCLYINGVRIHKTIVRSFKNDKLLEKIPNKIYTKMFSRVLEIKSYYASIVKEPIVIRQAPKDTLEAALNVWQPDTLIQNPAFLQFDIDYGIQVRIEQESNPSLRDKWVRLKFNCHLLSLKFSSFFENLYSFRRQVYQPSIYIKMPAEDLRAIYRALPVNAYVVVRY